MIRLPMVSKSTISSTRQGNILECFDIVESHQSDILWHTNAVLLQVEPNLQRIFVARAENGFTFAALRKEIVDLFNIPFMSDDMGLEMASLFSAS